MSLTNEQVKKIHYKPLALKYKVTEQYVGYVLRGEREANTEVAKSILEDAHKILKVIESND